MRIGGHGASCPKAYEMRLDLLTDLARQSFDSCLTTRFRMALWDVPVLLSWHPPTTNPRRGRCFVSSHGGFPQSRIPRCHQLQLSRFGGKTRHLNAT